MGGQRAAWISQRLGRRVGRQLGWVYLRRLGARLRVPRPRHVHPDPQAQTDFRQHLRPLLRGGQLAQLPAGVHGTTLREILSTPTGQAWWHEQGEIHPTLIFDITKGSQDVKVLNTYGRTGGL